MSQEQEFQALLGQRNPNSRIGYIAGVWDLFHVGHLRVLQRAKGFVDVLIVGLISDEYAARYKAKPVIPYDQRREILMSLGCVDMVVPRLGPEDTFPLAEMGIEVRFVGEGYEEVEVEARRRHLDELARRDITVIRLPKTPGISSRLIREWCLESIGGPPSERTGCHD